LVRKPTSVSPASVAIWLNSLLQGAIKPGASKVIAVDMVQKKLDIAKELGAHDLVKAQEVDPIQAVLELTHGEGVDVAVEAIGGTGTAS
jgi:Zn-dependent alcohol dehydrogenase